MGLALTCVHLKHHDPLIFKVSNIDSTGKERIHGKIEVTEHEIILHQRGFASIRWPLEHLRNYGVCEDFFYLESGRRGPTGEGIFAFECKQANLLYSLVEKYIKQATNQSRASVRSTEPRYNRRDSTNRRTINNNNLVNRRPSVLSENTTMLYDIFRVSAIPNGVHSAHDYMNNIGQYQNDSTSNPSITCDSSGQYYNSNSIPNSAVEPAYLYPVNSVSTDYVNYNCDSKKRRSKSLTPLSVLPGNPPILRTMSEGFGQGLTLNRPPPESDKSSPVSINETDIKYIELDIKADSEDVSAVLTKQPILHRTDSNVFKPTQDTIHPVSYAVIDFTKTAAVNSKCTQDNSNTVRKTRHDSSLNDL